MLWPSPGFQYLLHFLSVVACFYFTCCLWWVYHGTNCAGADYLKIKINNTQHSILCHLYLPLSQLTESGSHSLHSWLELPVMAWTPQSFVTVHFSAVSTSTSHDPRRMRAGTCAPRTGLHVSASELELPDQGRGLTGIVLNSDTHTPRPSPVSSVTNQPLSAPSTSTLSASVAFSLFWPLSPWHFPFSFLVLGALSSPFPTSTFPNVCHRGFSFPLCTITCVVPKGD